MTRNVIEMNTRIFSRLDEYCKQLDRPLQNAGTKRHIASGKQDDAFSAEAELVETHFPESERQILVLKHKSKIYFCMVGFRFLGKTPSVGNFNQTENNPGFLTMLFDQGRLRPQDLGDHLNEIIDVGFIGDGTDYQGHQYDQLETVFSPITIYETEDSDFSEMASQALQFCLLEKLGDPSIINKEITEEIQGLVDLGIEALPIETIYRSLFDADPGSLFLALYRCFEAIYSVKACRNLGLSLGVSNTWQEISRSLEESLSWRPREQESLASLLAPVSSITLSEILGALGKSETAESCEAVASAVYALRNRLVHFRPGMKPTDGQSTIDWHRLYIGMMGTLREVYGAIDE